MEGDSEADADAEESAGEGPSRPPRRRRKSRRATDEGTQTAPTTPKATKAGQFFFRDSPGTTPTSSRPNIFRRGTMSDIPENQRQGVSEDEGRDRLAKESTWTRGLHSARGLSYGGIRRHHDDNQDATGEKRPSNLRRLTGFATNNADGTPSHWRARSDRTQSMGAAKWSRVIAGLRILGQKHKAERTGDHLKSAELMAELLAGAPAALFLASMFQRDEAGHKRIPVLLEQLKFNIVDITKESDTKGGERHLNFRINLEYGNGLTRMKWFVNRTVGDFFNLHSKYKAQQNIRQYIQLKPDDKKGKIPRFPRSTIPYLRGIRGMMDIMDEDEDDEDDADIDREASGPDGSASATDRPSKAKRRQSSFAHNRRKSSISSPQASGITGQMVARTGSFAGVVGAATLDKANYAERVRKKLEAYLHQLITWLIFRPGSNRLCKFLELSSLGVRLATEGGYHGKEGFLTVMSSGKGTDLRKRMVPSSFKARHTTKWFMVRQSYIICVDSPEEMNVHDVILVDPNFTIQAKGRLRDQKPKEIASQAKASATHPNHHRLRLQNSERTIKLLAKSEKLLVQFEDSITFMLQNNDWAKPHRFGSFAPVRHKVFAQALVDGRDYMWNVSRAISMARDVIYIHDWWLSPELYMRRPAAISQKWRLDRLLKRKAQEGVKIFIIMYRNINTAIPIDSEHSKLSLLGLHPNVFVQRSPNQFRQNTFFWAHHEKLLVVDHAIAFCGGIDLCFGRWDTPQHAVVDDKLTGFELSDAPKDADHCQLWPGKDYSNPRVQDFYGLDKPYEEMYDRTKIPRMPWHDISMQMVGQPARDLTRHFVQRWNYILRQRKTSRPTPTLLPPPDFVPAEIEALGLEGTCEVQVLRSATSWSIGTTDKTEHSIMTAYVQMITNSEHFVYIENQFFISSCDVLGQKMENTIGDALVNRIIRAHENQEDWRACLVIPLMPGFQNTVDSQDGSSVRLIMTCQYRSICRGETSIFGKLREAGIEPEDYIQFYALRSWGAIGPTKTLVTEQLYIHAKCMIVDDRIAIIGSANINERSMLGSRDSEIATIVTDTEMIPSHMGGESYMVGRFAHELRVRLMREHLGVDVDEISRAEFSDEEADVDSDRFDSSSPPSPTADRATEQTLIESRHRVQDELIARAENLHSFNHDTDGEHEPKKPNIFMRRRTTADVRAASNREQEQDFKGKSPVPMRHMDEAVSESIRVRDLNHATSHEVLVSDAASKGAEPGASPIRSSKLVRERSNTATTRTSSVLGNASLPPPMPPRMNTAALGLSQLSQLPALPISDDTDIGGPPLHRAVSYSSSNTVNPLLADMRRPVVSDDCMRDPLNDAFYLDTWHAVAENNTKLFRQVFRCMPDNEVKNWKEYKEYAAFGERFQQAQGGGKSSTRKQQEAPGKTGPPGSGFAENSSHAGEKLAEKLSMENRGTNAPMGKVEDWAAAQEKDAAIPAAQQVNSPTANSGDEKVSFIAEDDRPSGKTSPFPPPPPIPNTTSVEDFAPDVGVGRSRTVTYSEPNQAADRSHRNTMNSQGSQKRRRRATTKSSMRPFHATDENALLEREDAENVLKLVQGHLVLWPYEWLVTEERGGGWLYTVDQLAPLEIYS
ncbi:phospholipase D [Mytilinidion resinicola]|uniref:Phospholipase n=1 Tax=Mytilinidion resinicola TaxID=574789 RepID=A0A6A6ZAE1_9PEZI|nr:phospholipase D [Mytilinidion resinicola]KAF2817255.1 phospholipase D [Mytilinidion resinicola]